MTRRKVSSAIDLVAPDTTPEATPPVPIDSSEISVGMIPRDRFEEKIKALRSSDQIENDSGVKVGFEGEIKEEFIRACEQSFPILEKTFETLYETGRFLHDVRSRLRPHRLYYAWLEFTGIPEGCPQLRSGI